ncbi:hypothetical protein Tco_1298017 [Tanacetum coccineum]
MDKGKGQIPRADDECFIIVKHRKLGGINGGNKHFKSVSMKPKTQYRPKVKPSTAEIASPVGTNKASNKESPKNKGNGSFSISNSFKVLNVDSLIIEEVTTGSNVTTSVDDDGKPIEKVDYLANSDNDEEVKPIENENASFLKGVGYGSKCLWEQWRETTVDAEYDPYDDEVYKLHKIPRNIQTICDNSDINVRGQKKKYTIFDV